MLIQEYKESWREDFNDIKNILKTALFHLQISIEHVGSTAVPKLAAKPIIDIDIVHDKDVEFEDIKIGLEKIGYYHNGNQGLIGREVFKRSQFTSSHLVLDKIVHHLYVCSTDSAQLERHILFRDFLIANEGARIYYENLKYAIAEEVNQDKKQYAQLKEIRTKEFIDSIIEKVKAGSFRNADLIN